MKIAVTGKGGVGKTTFCSLLAKAYASEGRRVLAIDADPNATLASCLGFPNPEEIVPIVEMADLIEERTGIRPGKQEAFFKLNPHVEDIPERFSVLHNGITLLRMGSLKGGGSGCYCPENALLKSLVSHLMLSEQDVLIMDMEAGVEHFGRGTASGVDLLLIVVEPSRQSVETARRIEALSYDIGLKSLGVVGNKCRNEEEEEFVVSSVAPLMVFGVLPYDDGLRLAEMERRPPEAGGTELDCRMRQIMSRLNTYDGLVEAR